jgi:lysozyme family protein
MDRNFARALPHVLKHESGWADHPADPDGATMKGLTLTTLRAYMKPDGTKQNLRKITYEQIATVYYGHCWAAVNAARPAIVNYAVFDFAVNSGPPRAAKFL